MIEAVNGFQMVKDQDVCVGQHTNLCLGVPCCDPKDIPNLVNENGEFKDPSYIVVGKNKSRCFK